MAPDAIHVQTARGEEGVLVIDHVHQRAVVDHHVLAHQYQGQGVADLDRGRFGHANGVGGWGRGRNQAGAAAGDGAVGGIEEHRTRGGLQIGQAHRQGLPLFGEHPGGIGKAQLDRLAEHLLLLGQVAGQGGRGTAVVGDQAVEAVVLLGQTAGQIQQNQFGPGAAVVPQRHGQDHPHRTGEGSAEGSGCRQQPVGVVAGGRDSQGHFFRHREAGAIAEPAAEPRAGEVQVGIELAGTKLRRQDMQLQIALQTGLHQSRVGNADAVGVGFGGADGARDWHHPQDPHHRLGAAPPGALHVIADAGVTAAGPAVVVVIPGGKHPVAADLYISARQQPAGAVHAHRVRVRGGGGGEGRGDARHQGGDLGIGCGAQQGWHATIAQARPEADAIGQNRAAVDINRVGGGVDGPGQHRAHAKPSGKSRGGTADGGIAVGAHQHRTGVIHQGAAVGRGHRGPGQVVHLGSRPHHSGDGRGIEDGGVYREHIVEGRYRQLTRCGGISCGPHRGVAADLNLRSEGAAAIPQVGHAGAAHATERAHGLHPHIDIAAAGGVAVAAATEDVLVQGIGGAQVHPWATDGGAAAHLHMAAAEDVVGGAGTGSRHSHGPCQGEGVAVGAGVDPSPITVTILLVGMAGDLQLLAGAERGVVADVRADGLVGGAAGFGTGHRHRHQADARGCRGGIGNHLILRFRRHHDGGGAEGGAIGHRRLHFGPLVAAEGLIPTQGGVGHHLAEGGADPSGSHAAPIGHRSQGVAPLGLQGEGARGGEGAGCFGQHRAGDGGIGAVHQHRSG